MQGKLPRMKSLAMLSVRDIANWSDPSQEAVLSYSDSMRLFHLLGPRARFMHGLPKGATILDAGAGDGGLVGMREWLMPHRSDQALWLGRRRGSGPRSVRGARNRLVAGPSSRFRRAAFRCDHEFKLYRAHRRSARLRPLGGLSFVSTRAAVSRVA